MDHPAGLRIVVADDDAAQREELSEFLRFRGHEVLTAGDGLAAIELIVRCRPRIAMIDVNMPGWDGIRVAEIATSLGADLALILISGDSASVVRANQAHVCAFAVVEKPLPLHHIARFVDAVSGGEMRRSG